jgi:hypothetical protein
MYIVLIDEQDGAQGVVGIGTLASIGVRTR